MTKFSKRHLVLTVTAAFVLLAPGFAFAGGKGGGGGKQAGGDRPTENSSLNYGKVEHTYTQKNEASTKTKRPDGGGATVGRAK
jgi:hypothetical protein